MNSFRLRIALSFTFALLLFGAAHAQQINLPETFRETGTVEFTTYRVAAWGQPRPVHRVSFRYETIRVGNRLLQIMEDDYGTTESFLLVGDRIDRVWIQVGSRDFFFFTGGQNQGTPMEGFGPLGLMLSLDTVRSGLAGAPESPMRQTTWTLDNGAVEGRLDLFGGTRRAMVLRRHPDGTMDGTELWSIRPPRWITVAEATYRVVTSAPNDGLPTHAVIHSYFPSDPGRDAKRLFSRAEIAATDRDLSPAADLIDQRIATRLAALEPLTARQRHQEAFDRMTEIRKQTIPSRFFAAAEASRQVGRTVREANPISLPSYGPSRFLLIASGITLLLFATLWKLKRR